MAAPPSLARAATSRGSPCEDRQPVPRCRLDRAALLSDVRQLVLEQLAAVGGGVGAGAHDHAVADRERARADRGRGVGSSAAGHDARAADVCAHASRPARRVGERRTRGALRARERRRAIGLVVGRRTGEVGHRAAPQRVPRDRQVPDVGPALRRLDGARRRLLCRRRRSVAAGARALAHDYAFSTPLAAPFARGSR
jgi:hypothetical protein